MSVTVSMSDVRDTRKTGVGVGVGFSDTLNLGVCKGVSVRFRHQKNIAVSGDGFSDTQNPGVSVGVGFFDSLTPKILVAVSDVRETKKKLVLVSDYQTHKILVSVSDVRDTSCPHRTGVSVKAKSTSDDNATSSTLQKRIGKIEFLIFTIISFGDGKVLSIWRILNHRRWVTDFKQME